MTFWIWASDAPSCITMTMAFGGSLRFRFAEEKSKIAEIKVRGAWRAEFLRSYKVLFEALATICI
jgi:hypothetical protein